MDVRITEGIALLIVLLSMWEGARKGFLMKLYSMVRVILVIVLTVIAFPIITKVLPTEFSGSVGVAVVVALIIAIVVVTVVAGVLHIVDHIPVVNSVNRLGGALLGGVLGVVLVWILLMLLLAFSDMKEIQPIVKAVAQSKILMMIQNFNPITYFMKDFHFSLENFMNLY